MITATLVAPISRWPSRWTRATPSISQAWRTKMWPAGVYSIVHFELVKDGANTKLVLDHTGYPAEQHDHLSAGWTANYFEPLAKFLAR